MTQESTPPTALGPMQRCPECGTKFQQVHDVDAHLASLPTSQSDEALVTQADREAVKRHQQRFLAEGTSETKLLLEAFASHRLAALRAVWTPVDVVGLGARMATLTDSNALPTTIQLIVDMYDALERLSHERASARAAGKREGIEEAAIYKMEKRNGR